MLWQVESNTHTRWKYASWAQTNKKRCKLEDWGAKENGTVSCRGRREEQTTLAQTRTMPKSQEGTRDSGRGKRKGRNQSGRRGRERATTGEPSLRGAGADWVQQGIPCSNGASHWKRIDGTCVSRLRKIIHSAVYSASTWYRNAMSQSHVLTPTLSCGHSC